MGLRRTWFQVHKWIGIALCVVLIPLSLSGSVLLAHDWFEEEEGEVAPAAPLPLSHYVAAAASTLPAGARIASVSLPSEEAPAVTVAAFPAATDGPQRGRPRPIRVALDPATARVVPADNGDDFFEVTLHRFHGSLLIPVAGRPIVGWLGILMLVSCVSGLWLWWPTVGRWLRALRWRRGDKLDYNLHHQVGFWIALPLAVLSLSGAWISFPGFFGGLSREHPARPDRRAFMPVVSPHLTLDVVAQRFRQRGPIGQVSYPTEQGGRWIAQIGGEERRERLAIDDATGAFVAPDMAHQGPLMNWMRAIHEGHEETGPIWRFIVVLGGIAPAILGVTGITMWLRSRRWRATLAAKTAARRAG